MFTYCCCVQEGAFDVAVQGVDAIEHTASPVSLHADDPSELITPAVNGTLGILKSALAYGLSVKRIVITSSCAAVASQGVGPRVYNETDWNNSAVREIEEKGKAAAPLVKYRASKTLAEKAAWDFYAKNKDAVGWDLVVINPPWVFGPVLHAVSSPQTLNESMLEWYKNVCEGAKDDEFLAITGFVHVFVLSGGLF